MCMSVISVQQKRCKITTQEATRTKNELKHTALRAVQERVLCSRRLEEGGIITGSEKCRREFDDLLRQT